MATPSLAWKALTEDKDPTNWIVMHFGLDKSMIVHKKGNGGLEQLKKEGFESKDANKEVVVAAVKVMGVDQQQNVTSRRPKYVLITVIPRDVTPLRRGLILQKKADIDNTFKGVTCLLQYNNCDAPPKELTHLAIGKSLLAAGGAHKPVFYDFGNREHLSLKNIYENKDWDSTFPDLDAAHANSPAPAPASPQAPASPAAAVAAVAPVAAAPASPQADAAPAPAPADAAPAAAAAAAPADAPKPE